MKSLYETVSQKAGSRAASVIKHLKAVGIEGWDGLNRASLYEFRDELLETVAASTAKVTMANLASIIGRYQDELPNLPAGWRDILKAKGGKVVKTYLTEAELAKLERVLLHTSKETFILNVFLVSAWTGARVSDAIRLSPANISEDGTSLSYVAIKTGKQSILPLKRGLEARLAYIASHQQNVSLTAYNKAIRRLARRAGINTPVVVIKGGVEKKGPKWMFLTSHTARISTATCLAKRGAGVEDIRSLLAHSSIQQTMRYIVQDKPQLSPKAMKFFE